MCRPTEITCVDCHETARVGSRGRIPTRCRKCTVKKCARSTKSVCEFCGDVVVSTCKRKWCDKCRAVFTARATYKCINCGNDAPILGGKSARTFCSLACYSAATRRQRQAAKEAAKKEGMMRRAAVKFEAMIEQCKRDESSGRFLCRRCKRPMPFLRGQGKWARFCSSECRQSAAHARRTPGSKKHTTRAKKRGLPRQYSITLQKVAERDGWLCRLCCKTVDRGLDHHDPMAACIDHIVPLNMHANARHGHVWNNVQLAHRRCNEAKGCTVACCSLLDCMDPRKHIASKCIDQSPPPRGAKRLRAKTFLEAPGCPSANN